MSTRAAETVVPPTSSVQRVDIQALRGLAILLVLVYHSGLFPNLKAGYLGVDIFFVVSGYLITGIVMRGVQAGTFSFQDLYLRRAKRLLPAAYVTFVATTIGASLFLTQLELRDYSCSDWPGDWWRWRGDSRNGFVIPMRVNPRNSDYLSPLNLNLSKGV